MKEMRNNIIDLSYLELTFKGNKGLIIKILKSVIDNSPNELVELSNYEKDKNWEQVKMTAHKLKTSFETIGAKKVADILLNIELTSSNKDTMKISELISEASNLSVSVFEEIKIQLSNKYGG